jgi:HEAT repeat protein
MLSPWSLDPDAVPVLVELLRDPHPGVRRLAALELSQASREPEAVVPVLVDMLGTKDPALRLLAVVGLGKYGPDAIAAGNRFLEESDADVRIAPEGEPRRVERKKPEEAPRP